MMIGGVHSILLRDESRACHCTCDTPLMHMFLICLALSQAWQIVLDNPTNTLQRLEKAPGGSRVYLQDRKFNQSFRPNGPPECVHRRASIMTEL
jgi:hypothetical protein